MSEVRQPRRGRQVGSRGQEGGHGQARNAGERRSCSAKLCKAGIYRESGRYDNPTLQF